MPNWCENNLTVRGPEEEIKRFLEGTKGTDEEGEPTYDIVNSWFPVPAILDDIHSGYNTISGKKFTLWRDDENGKSVGVTKEEITQLKDNCGFTNSYDWCIANWGSKWGDCYTDLVQMNDENLLFYFESAWGPPTEGLTKIAKDFPKLFFYLTYQEPGMCFEGYVRWDDGELIEEHSQGSTSWATSEFGQEWRREKEPVRYD